MSFKDVKFTNVNLAGALTEDANIDGLTILGHDIQVLPGAHTGLMGKGQPPE